MLLFCVTFPPLKLNLGLDNLWSQTLPHERYTLLKFHNIIWARKSPLQLYIALYSLCTVCELSIYLPRLMLSHVWLLGLILSVLLLVSAFVFSLFRSLTFYCRGEKLTKAVDLCRSIKYLIVFFRIGNRFGRQVCHCVQVK